MRPTVASFTFVAWFLHCDQCLHGAPLCSCMQYRLWTSLCHHKGSLDSHNGITSRYRILAVLFLILDCCDQEKHRAASFVPHVRMLVQHFLCRLRFGEPGDDETSIN